MKISAKIIPQSDELIVENKHLEYLSMANTVSLYTLY